MRFGGIGGPFRARSPICSQCNEGVLGCCQNPNYQKNKNKNKKLAFEIKK